MIKKILTRFFAFALVCLVGLTGCATSYPSGLTGNYSQDTLALVNTLRTAIELPEDVENKSQVQSEARLLINDFISRYRRDGAYQSLASFTTMQTALNSLAGHYSSYPNRPVPEKLRNRLELELRRVETALKRES